jgi:hypothetical protein
VLQELWWKFMVDKKITAYNSRFAKAAKRQDVKKPSFLFKIPALSYC